MALLEPLIGKGEKGFPADSDAVKEGLSEEEALLEPFGEEAAVEGRPTPSNSAEAREAGGAEEEALLEPFGETVKEEGSIAEEALLEPFGGRGKEKRRIDRSG